MKKTKKICDEILKADKMLNHYRWKAEKLILSMQATNKSLVELQGAVGSYSVQWAEDAVAKSQHQIQRISSRPHTIRAWPK